MHVAQQEVGQRLAGLAAHHLGALVAKSEDVVDHGVRKDKSDDPVEDRDWVVLVAITRRDEGKVQATLSANTEGPAVKDRCNACRVLPSHSWVTPW